jgi:hypothetical protein
MTEISSGHKEVPVTHHEKVTREEIARRNYTEGTTRAYLRVLDDLPRHFQRRPNVLQIRAYKVHLFRIGICPATRSNRCLEPTFFLLQGSQQAVAWARDAVSLPVIWSPMRSLV